MNSLVCNKLPEDLDIGDIVLGTISANFNDGWKVISIAGTTRNYYDFIVRRTSAPFDSTNWTIGKNTMLRVESHEQPYDPTQMGDTAEDI